MTTRQHRIDCQRYIIGLCLLAGSDSTALSAPPMFTAVRVGLLDAEHTQLNGARHSGFSGVRGFDRAAGSSFRYVGGGCSNQSAWVWDGQSDRRTGLFGSGYLTTTGCVSSQINDIDSAGRVIGISQKFQGDNYNGSTGWLDAGGQLTTLGLLAGGPTLSSLILDHTPLSLLPRGDVLGLSYWYQPGNLSISRIWWIFDGQNSVPIGLFDAEHSGTGNLHNGAAIWRNAAGRFTGWSQRYDGVNASGATAWVLDRPSTYTRIGLFDSLHTRASDGYRDHEPIAINANGWVLGSSVSFWPNGEAGGSAWVYDNQSTTRIGIFDSEHTSPTNLYQYSSGWYLDDSGRVLGVSTRFTSSGPTNGRSAWVWAPGPSSASGGGPALEIGLLDAEHTGPGGYRDNSPVAFVTGAGSGVAGVRAVGSARRSPNGDVIDRGKSLWYFDGTTTRRLGLTDAEHTDSSGYRESTFVAANSAGLILGKSTHYLPSQGATAWIFDAVTGMTTVLPSVSRPSDGYRDTLPNVLLDSGVVYGQYAAFDPVFLGYRAFRWSAADGFTDLGSLIHGGLAAAGEYGLTAIVTVDPAEAWIAVAAQGLPADVAREDAVLLRRICRGDFNADGQTTLQDIFDFLAAWFANSAAADVNNSGAVSVQDIFDYLAAYFGLC